MKIGFVQFAPIFGAVKENLAKAEMLLNNLDGELAVLPEFFNTGYLFSTNDEVARLAEEAPDGMTTAMLISVARKKNIYIVAGLPERAGDLFYNSAVIVSPQGFAGVYRKTHLFFEERLFFTPGNSGLNVFDIGTCKIGVMVCFDWFFPESMRVLALKGADVICHCANLVLPYCQDAMVTRCLENGVFAVTANRTGSDVRSGKRLDFTGASQITGRKGEIIHRASSKEDEVLSIDIDVLAASNKQLNEYNNLFKDRRCDYYGEIMR